MRAAIFLAGVMISASIKPMEESTNFSILLILFLFAAMDLFEILKER